MREEMMQAEQNGSPKSSIVEVPSATPWPFVTSFGLALLVAGLVTSLAVSVVGLIVIFSGAVGWFGNVFPMPQHELIDVSMFEAQALPVARSTRKVDHLIPGAQGNRVYIPTEVLPYS